MADDLTQQPDAPAPEVEVLPAVPEPSQPPVAEQQPDAAQQPAAARPRTGGVFVARFRFAYLVLALLVGGAVGSFMVLYGNGTTGEGPQWSTWQPEGDSAERIGAIADFVGQRYRIDGGGQLVAVTVNRPPVVQDVAVRYVALSAGPGDQNINVLPAEDTVAYVLCGLGQGCSIPNGPATPERGRLLRREALELALYTFKYVDGVDSVVALLPPRARSDTRFALFFEKNQIEPVLDAPLHRTLPATGSLTPSSALETSVISRYADPRLFQYTYGQAGDGSVYMALEPPQL